MSAKGRVVVIAQSRMARAAQGHQIRFYGRTGLVYRHHMMDIQLEIDMVDGAAAADDTTAAVTAQDVASLPTCRRFPADKIGREVERGDERRDVAYALDRTKQRRQKLAHQGIDDTGCDEATADQDRSQCPRIIHDHLGPVPEPDEQPVEGIALHRVGLTDLPPSITSGEVAESSVDSQI